MLAKTDRFTVNLNVNKTVSLTPVQSRSICWRFRLLKQETIIKNAFEKGIIFNHLLVREGYSAAERIWKNQIVKPYKYPPFITITCVFTSQS
jgi:hypothetical protein